MPKKLIITVSVAALLIGLAVFTVVFLRTRALSDVDPTQPAVTSDGADGTGPASSVDRAEAKAPGTICGDGICAANETSCHIDCGSGEAYFLASVVVQPVSETSVRATWKTRSASTGVFRYGLTDAVAEGSSASSEPATEHVQMIGGLSPESNYYFGISVTENGTTYAYGPYLSEGIGPPDTQ